MTRVTLDMYLQNHLFRRHQASNQLSKIKGRVTCLFDL